MSLFDTALDTQFGSALAVDVTYLYATGSKVVVRAMYRAPDVESNLGLGKVKQISAVFDIRSSEIKTVSKEDRILLDGCRSFRILNISQNDPRRAIWTLEAAEEV